MSQCWQCQHHQKKYVGETGDGKVYFTSFCQIGRSFGLQECNLFVERENKEEIIE